MNKDELLARIAGQSYTTIKSDLQLLADVLGVPAKVSGHHHCPFHDDKTGSLSLNERDGVYLWFCHGCKACGTVVESLILSGLSKEELDASLGRSTSSRPKPYRLVNRQKVKGNVASAAPIAHQGRLQAAIDFIERCSPLDLEIGNQRRGLLQVAVQQHTVAYIQRDFLTLGTKIHDFENCWLFAITDKYGHPKAIKQHYESPPKGQSKSRWLPVGQSSHGFNTLWPPPEMYDDHGLGEWEQDWPEEWQREYDKALAENRGFAAATGETETILRQSTKEEIQLRKRIEAPETKADVVLTFGELKALAVRSTSLPATSRTSGEAAAWTPEMIGRLAGRKVLVLYDDDDAGIRCRDEAIRVLRPVATSLKAASFGQHDSGGKIDANDIAVAEGTNGLRTQLRELWASAEELAAIPFDIAAHRQDLFNHLKAAVLGDPTKVYLFQSVVGAGKSRATQDVVNETPIECRFVIFCPSHAVAKEYEESIPGALRMVSPDQMTEEGLFECPYLRNIKKLRGNGLPYVRRVCQSCSFRGKCPAFNQRKQSDTARVVLLQHAHLKMIGNRDELFEGRVRIVDEYAIGNGFRWEERFCSDDIDGFVKLLVAYETENAGSGELAGLKLLCCQLQSALDGPVKLSVSEKQDCGDLKDFTKWLGECVREERNLAFILRDAIVHGIPIRREGAIFHAIMSAIPDQTQPLIVLDATASEEAYGAIFQAERLEIWPKEQLPAPNSEVIQFVDGLYPAMSLISSSEPTPTFFSICDQIEATRKKNNIAWGSVGIVTLKKAVEFVHERFPDLPRNQIVNYGGQRGVNALKDCDLVAIIGCQPPPDEALAKEAVILFGLACSPESLLVGQDRTSKTFMPAKSVIGSEYEILGRQFADDRLAMAWELKVESEIVQAIGRARPYELREKRQTVLVFTNQPLPCPVTRHMRRVDHLLELGIEPNRRGPLSKRDDRQEAVRVAITNLKQYSQSFSYCELAKVLNVSASTIKNDGKWREIIKLETESLGIEFKRAGNGQPGSFVPMKVVEIRNSVNSN